MNCRHFLTSAIAVSLIAVGIASQDITVHKRTRIKFAKGASSKLVHGFIGGEQHDEWFLNVKKGQHITVEVMSGLKTLDPDFAFLKRVSPKKATWYGTATKSGDIQFNMYAHPDSHYQFKVTVR